ncbi:sensor histidine kinase [Actinacidiphila glaucinigra]|uniref:histidine kinase n=1 Tax=Actinacidiphila glaucinigra TaxID=235986 RepID=A0A239CR68_9ACTN|nr:HAMP domain-containing sensor histidine kinase [Actinacidiphila glaucinigra]SNS22597.1 Signal transduction histidine kinase [Actinacidiphila glaucinigra]
MSTVTGAPSGRVWRGSLRVQLTAVFGLLFFVAATAVLAGSLILVRNGMRYSLDLAFDPRVFPVSNEMTKAVIVSSMERNLLAKGGITVLVVGVLATTAGWLAAGRLLRPLHRITSTAERIAGRTLHRRIALEMPPGEVKRLADTFDRMLDRLDGAFAGQERFIANAAHELKTPLVINRTLVEVAMNRPDAPVELLRLGENLLAVNARHERLIDALLTLARAEDALTDRVPLDLADVCDAVVTAAEPEAERQRVRLEAGLDPAPSIGDPILLEQLVRNLVDNAVRYNESGGLVRVTTAHDRHGPRVVVANTGARISAHEIPVLFEPFRRLTDRVGSARGSGLGLSIVRAVARAHGGDVTAEPRHGGGLTVTVALPARHDHARLTGA